MRRSLVVFSVLTLASACARPASESSRPADRTIVTREELTHTRYANLYDAVSALRRNWLQPRGVDSFSNPPQVRVYLDNVMLGGTESLRNLPSNSVMYMKWFDGVAATTRWGTDHAAGVIFLSTRPLTSNPN